MTDRQIDSYEAKQKFIEDMRLHGSLVLNPGDDLIADGQFHRCTASNKEGSRGKGDGSYILHLTSDAAFGGYQNFTKRTGFISWHYRSPGHRLSAEELKRVEREYKEHRAAAEAKRAKACAKATREANELWQAAEPAGGKGDFETHQYLRNKGIKAHGARVLNGVLLVPMYSFPKQLGAGTKLVNLQKINNRGDKWLIKGGQKISTYAQIKAAPDDDGSTIALAEGYSTACSINEATGYQVFISIGTDILRLAHWLADEYPKCKRVVCADDDHKEPDNPGLSAALEATRATKSWLAIPILFPADRKNTDTDFNDLMRLAGAKAVRRAIDAAIDSDDIDALLGPDEATEETKKKGTTMTDKQADVLVRLAESEAVLFHSFDDAGYAKLEVNDHHEVWPIRSNRFKQWLMRAFYLETKKAPGTEAMSSALSLIESKAFHDGEQHPVFLRIANFEGKVYLDLCDEDWRVVRIDENGWKVIKESPVRFIRRQGMQALPLPVHGGSVTDLGRFINVKDDEFVLVVSYLLAALRGHKPFPILSVCGESGSAKSTMLQIMRALIDPNIADLRAPPRSNRDVFIAASNAYVLCFDNLSDLPIWLSDTLSRIATGAGFGTRMLYKDDDEKLFNAARPIQLGAIENVLTKGDIVQRTITVKLGYISDKKRRDEKEFWQAFHQAQPKILGALLTAVANGLKALPDVKLKKLPRMADFAKWGVAVGKTLWPGTFMQAYRNNQAGAVADVVEANMLASEIQHFMIKRNGESWTGTASRLWRSLHDRLDDEQRKNRAWPKSASHLSRKLPEVTSDLRKLGIRITESPRDENNRKQITIKAPARQAPNSAVSAVMPLEHKRHKAFKDGASNGTNGTNGTMRSLSGKARDYDLHDEEPRSRKPKTFDEEQQEKWEKRWNKRKR
jgi:phage/plasmid primase-like uncharacterized protein